MIGLASRAPRRLPIVPPEQLYGTGAVSIREAEARRAGVSLEELLGSTLARPVVECRQTIAFRVWTEIPAATLSLIARLIGRRDHSAAIHAIIAGAHARGFAVARVSDLRETGTDPIDWTKIAYAAAGWRERHAETLQAAARRAGIGRGEWRKVELGRSVSAGSLLAVCRLVGVDPLTLLAAHDTHETAVKHGTEAGGAA